MIKVSSSKIGISVKIIQDNINTDINTYLRDIYDDLDLDYSKFFKMDNLCKLGVLGTELLYRENQDLFNTRGRIGIVLQNKSSSLDSDVKHQKGMNNDVVSPSVFVYTLPNIVIAEISIKYKWNTEGVFFVGKSLDPILLSQYSNILLRKQRTDLNLLGWIDVLEDKYCLRLCAIESIIQAEELKRMLV